MTSIRSTVTGVTQWLSGSVAHGIACRLSPPVMALALLAVPVQASKETGEVLDGEGFQHGEEWEDAAFLPAELTGRTEWAEQTGEEAGEPMRLSMDFKDADLKNVLKTFSQQTGVNVIAGEAIGDLKITVYVEDVTPMDALDRILDAADLTTERPPGSHIYVVKPKPEAAGEPEVAVETRVYRLKFARVSSSRLAVAAETLVSQTPFEASKAQATTLSTGSSAQPSNDSISGFGTGGGAGQEVGIDRAVGEVLTEHGKVTVDERTNSLIVTDAPENFPRIEAVLSALDVRTAQIMIEAEVLETSLAKAKDLGIKWGTSSEGDVFSFDPATRSTRLPFTRSGSEITAGTGIQFGTLDTKAAFAVLQALERDTNTKILARPKVLTLDNESALIRLTTLQAVGFQTTSGEATQTTSVTPERMTTGVILVVTPQVNEGGFITMLVEPSVTQVATARVTPPSNAGTVVDPKTRSARALVRIPNGETLVLGGLIDRTEEQVVQRVPILSDIPFMGEAFKKRETDRSESELIVFVTPRLLTEPALQVAVSGAPVSLGAGREQEPLESRQRVMEEWLNALEQTMR